MSLAFFIPKLSSIFGRVVKFTKILPLRKYLFSKYINGGFLELLMVAYYLAKFYEFSIPLIGVRSDGCGWVENGPWRIGLRLMVLFVSMNKW